MTLRCSITIFSGKWHYIVSRRKLLTFHYGFVFQFTAFFLPVIVFEQSIFLVYVYMYMCIYIYIYNDKFSFLIHKIIGKQPILCSFLLFSFGFYIRKVLSRKKTIQMIKALKISNSCHISAPSVILTRVSCPIMRGLLLPRHGYQFRLIFVNNCGCAVKLISEIVQANF